MTDSLQEKTTLSCLLINARHGTESRESTLETDLSLADFYKGSAVLGDVHANDGAVAACWDKANITSKQMLRK